MKTIAIKGRIIPLLITGLCLIFLASNSAQAQNKQAKNVKTISIEAKEVKQENKAAKLTDDQKAKIKDLRIENMNAIRLLKTQGEELKAHLKTLNIAEKPDNKAIFKTIDELTANHGDMMKRMITFKQSVKALLTPEQLKALELRGINKHMQMGRRNQMGRMQGNRNVGRGQMMQRGGMNRQGQMQRGGMNRPGQMMQRGQGQGQGQMFRGGMSPKEQMIIRQGGQGFGGGQMAPQAQMQRRFQMIRQGRPLVSDSTKTK
jgi:Spy/CpxP family protein refolding chaperone